MDSKEEEITRRIEMLRKKNALLEQRHKEVQADKKSAEKSGQLIHEGSSRYHSYRQQNAGDHSGNGNPKTPFSGAHMDDETEEGGQRNNHRYRRGPPRGRGQLNVNPSISRRGRGGRYNQTYEAKRLENFRMMEEEMAQASETIKTEPDPSSGISRLLDDPRRKGGLDPDNRWKSTRHKGNYGGIYFENVKSGMRWRGKSHRGGGRGREMSRMQETVEYTGRERQDQQRWQAMREAADREILARSKNAEGGWRREWDSEKGGDNEVNQDSRYHKHYSEPRSRGRGKRDFGRAPHSGIDQEQPTKKTTDIPAASIQTEEDDQAHEDKETKATPDSAKPQRVRNKQNKSPRHLLQQRAQTPSSKDGTEVWTQNSHHSDEAGGEWKNGTNQSGDQWMPSSEGNRNPAIDERLLEQQEDGATIYSQQLGRGWGSEKNIKATKAWVIDTERAGAAKGQEDNQATGSDIEQLVKESNEHTRSASPRLKGKNVGLSVEINKTGRHVRSQLQEPQSAHEAVEGASAGGAEALQSPDFLKTPEDMKHVTDWATEMDMQSPTYEARQLELMKNVENMLPQVGKTSECRRPNPVPNAPKHLASAGAVGETSDEKQIDSDNPPQIVEKPRHDNSNLNDGDAPTEKKLAEPKPNNVSEEAVVNRSDMLERPEQLRKSDKRPGYGDSDSLHQDSEAAPPVPGSEQTDLETAPAASSTELCPSEGKAEFQAYPTTVEAQDSVTPQSADDSDSCIKELNSQAIDSNNSKLQNEVDSNTAEEEFFECDEDRTKAGDAEEESKSKDDGTDIVAGHVGNVGQTTPSQSHGDDDT